MKLSLLMLALLAVGTVTNGSPGKIKRIFYLIEICLYFYSYN